MAYGSIQRASQHQAYILNKFDDIFTPIIQVTMTSKRFFPLVTMGSKQAKKKDGPTYSAAAGQRSGSLAQQMTN
jgi:hypothetical protein